MKNIYFFQFLGVLSTQGPHTSAKNPNQRVKNWGQICFCEKCNLKQRSQEIYVRNHKFNVFKRFWKQKIKNLFPAKKSLIKAQKSGKNRKNRILASFLPRLRDLGVIIVGINEAHVHTYFGHFPLVLSGFSCSCYFWPFLTELSVLAKIGQNMAGWLVICLLS